MYSFMAVSAYAPYLLTLQATGKLEGMSATYPFGLEAPVGTLRTLTLIAHFLTVLLAVGVVVAAYDAGRTMWDERTGVIAALFALTSFPMFYYARTGNIDVPALFFVALALALFARCVVLGVTLRRIVWLGIWIGFAGATKESMAGALVVIPVVLIARNWRAARAPTERTKLLKAAMLGTLATLLSFGLGSGLFVDPERFFAHLAHVVRIRRLLEMIPYSGSLVRYHPSTIEGYLSYLRETAGYVVDALTLPGALLALLGIGWTFARERRTSLLVLPALTYVVYLIASYPLTQFRYVLPVAFVLTFYIARTVVLAWNSRRPIIRIVVATSAAVALLVSVLRGVELTYEMLNDSRFAAAAWLASRTSPGDVVEYFGSTQKLPPLETGVVSRSATDYAGMYVEHRVDDEKVLQIQQAWKRNPPRYVIVAPDHTSRYGAPYPSNLPTPLFDRLVGERDGYRLSGFFKTPPLLPWVKLPALDYPTVNPPIRIFDVRIADG